MGVRRPGWDARAAHREDSVTYSLAEQNRKPGESLEGNHYREKASRLQECEAAGHRHSCSGIRFLSSEIRLILSEELGN